MFTWKRILIVLSLPVLGSLILQFGNVPTVAAQVKAALVRSVDEPARVPYFISAQPSCPFLNECLISGSVVPAGKRLRVTRLSGFIHNQTSNLFGALSLNDDGHVQLMFLASTFTAGFFSNVVSFNQDVDYYFEGGQTPVLEVGAASGLANVTNDSFNRLTITGYIVDTTP